MRTSEWAVGEAMTGGSRRSPVATLGTQGTSVLVHVGLGCVRLSPEVPRSVVCTAVGGGGWLCMVFSPCPPMRWGCRACGFAAHPPLPSQAPTKNDRSTGEHKGGCPDHRPGTAGAGVRAPTWTHRPVPQRERPTGSTGKSWSWWLPSPSSATSCLWPVCSWREPSGTPCS